MPDLDADVVLDLFSAIVLPLIVAFNIHDRKSPSSAISQYMWSRQPLLWSVGLAFLSVLALFSVVEVLAWLRWLPATTIERLMPVIGVPALLLAIAVLGLGVRAGYQVLRGQ